MANYAGSYAGRLTRTAAARNPVGSRVKVGKGLLDPLATGRRIGAEAV